MILFADRGCPFAHRVLALLDYLGRSVDLRESFNGESLEGIEQYSSSRAVPLLVHEKMVLTESRVILEYIAERYDFGEAYPADLDARSRHRHAMAVMDDYLVPMLFSPGHIDGAQLEDALNSVEQATATEMPHPCLLVFHLVPIWLRFRWWHPTHVVTHAVEARTTLCEWFESAAKLGCLLRTVPDPVTHKENIERAQQLLRMPIASQH